MQINDEKQRKLRRYKEEKEGLVKSSNKETCDFLLKEVKYSIRSVLMKTNWKKQIKN